MTRFSRFASHNFHSLASVRGIAVVLVATIQPAQGQFRTQPSAHDSASRAAAISVFAEPQYLHPAYSAGTSLGLAAGADLTRFFRTPVLPSLEVRAGYAPTGGSDGESTVLIGARLDLPFLHLARIHPYGNFLVGSGTIHFAHPAAGYPSDNSTVYNYGGGVNLDLLKNFGIQGEYQRQHWNLGNQGVSTNFTPYSINLGVRYQIPFGSRRPR